MPTRNLAVNNQLASRIINAIIARSERKIQRAYLKALRDVRHDMADLYARASRADGTMTLVEARKYNRLQALEKKIQEQISPYLNEAIGEIERLPARTYREAYRLQNWAVDQALGVHIDMLSIPARAVREAVANPLRKISENRLRNITRNKIRSVVTQGFIHGLGYRDMAAQIKDGINGTASNALTIARTEGQRAAVLGQQAAYAEAEKKGVEGDVIWDATLDSRTRPQHQTMDGRKRGEDGLFASPVGRIAGPLQSGVAGFDINCMPGDTHVTGNVEAVYRRWYEGDLYTITTDVGMRLSVTVNHPILTLRGWLSAKSLKKGDHVICGSLSDPSAFGDVDVERMPTSVEQIFDSLALSGTAERVPGFTSQFHGDGMNTDVDIVFADRNLRDAFYFPLSEPIQKHHLSVSDDSALSSGTFSQFVDSGLSSSDGIVSSRGKTPAFFGRSLAHPKEHGIATISRSNADAFQSPSHSRTTDVEIAREGFDRRPVKISLFEIVDVDVNAFSGHVYNLQTSEGLYFAHNNIHRDWCIVHNCRCTLRYQINETSPQLRRARDRGIIPNQTYDKWRKG